MSAARAAGNSGAALVAILVALAAGWAAAPARAAGLGPTEARRLMDALDAASRSGAPFVVDGVEVQRDRATLRLRARPPAPPRTRSWLLLPPEAPRAGSRRTRSGTLVPPQGASPEFVEAVVRTLDTLDPPLRWQPTGEAKGGLPETDLAAARRDERAARAWWEAARAGPLSGPDDPRAASWLDERVRAAWRALRRGKAARARAILRPLVRRRGLAPLGAVTLWACANGLEEPRRARLGADARIPPGEPRVAALMAQAERRAGRLDGAARQVDAALAAPLLDPMAVSEARALGWHVEETARAVPSPRPLHHAAWPWVLVAACVVLGWIALVVLDRDRWVLAAGLAGLAAASWVVWGQGHPHVARPRLPVELRWPLAGGPCRPLPSVLHPRGWTAAADCRGKLLEVVVTVDDSNGGQEPRVRIGPVRGEPAARLGTQARALVADAVRRAQRAGWRWEAPAAVRSTAWPAWAALPPTTRARIALAALLVVAGVVVALGAAAEALRRVAGAGAASKWALGGLLVFAAVHAATPSQLLMSFSAYDITNHLARGAPWRYGAGPLWFYGPPMWVLGPDHAWLQRFNRAWGVLGCILATGVAAALWEDRKAAAWVPWLLLAAPITALLDASESIVVAPGVVALAGYFLAVEGRWAAAVLAWSGASLGRPEIAPVALVGMPFVAWLWRRMAPSPPGLRGKVRALGVAAAAVLLAVAAVRFGEILEDARELARSGAIQGAHAGIDWGWLLAQVHNAWFGDSILLSPRVVPFVVPLGIAAAAFARTTRRQALSALALALGWQAITAVDITQYTAARIHEPVLWFMAPVAAAGWVCAMGTLRRRGTPRLLSATLGLGALALVAVSGVQTVRFFAPDRNEQAEERLWRRLARTLPEGVRCIYALDSSDPPAERYNFRYHPTYLFEARTPPVSFEPLREAADPPARCAEGGVAVVCVHCYARYGRPPDAPSRNPLCSETAGLAGARPLWEVDEPNLGDTEYPLYPKPSETPWLRLGVWRLPPARGAGSAPSHDGGG